MIEFKDFKHKDFGTIRSVTIHGISYFMAIDIGKALGYKNPEKAAEKYCSGTFLGITRLKTILKLDDTIRLIDHSDFKDKDHFRQWVEAIYRNDFQKGSLYEEDT